MKKIIWDRFAPFYKIVIKADKKIYESMYERILNMVKNKDVLELATGPGTLAKYVAKGTKKMIATDYSFGMIKTAKKGSIPQNLTFEIADATNLSYGKNSFDVVIIANALHIMPNPDSALKEIKRVLKPDGILIAPNFINHKKTKGSKMWFRFLKFLGINFEHQWTSESYKTFLLDHGWEILYEKVWDMRVTMIYVECKSDNIL